MANVKELAPAGRSEAEVATVTDKRLARLVASNLNQVGLVLRVPDLEADRALDFFTRCINTFPDVNRRNDIGREIFETVKSVEELLPPQESAFLEAASSHWFDKTFPGKRERWQKKHSK